VNVLKGVFKVGRGFVTPRKVLIVLQFTIAIVLITSTMVIHRQIQFAKARDTGYNKSRLVSFQINEQSRPTKDLLRRELLETGVAEAVSINFASMFESEDRRTDHLRWAGKDPGNLITFERNYAQEDWSKTTGVHIIQGRDIDIFTYPSDSTAMLLNETAVKLMGFNDPVGEIIYEWNTPYHVVGVVKDFVLESPYDPILPMIIGGAKGGFNNVNVKLSAHGTLAENLGLMEQIYRKYNPGEPMRYNIVDEIYARRFDREQRMGSLVTWFAGLAVFISCLGLFGLTAYMAENRRKEIGIRKVLGASIFDIVSLLSKEFLVLVAVSLVIALPVAWWAMNLWLSNYAYRTNIPWWLFVVVGCMSLGIALVTVGFQAFKAATENPVKAIKSE
jgi:ABC-type antimicrobial peptide transport system permease subunit